MTHLTNPQLNPMQTQKLRRFHRPAAQEE